MPVASLLTTASRRLAALCVALALFVPGCGPLAQFVAGVAATPGEAYPARAELTVFAAASLAEPFKEIGAGFGRAHPDVRVVFGFAGSQQLRAQLEQGAPADVFASADEVQLGRAREAGLVLPDARVFARNRLVVVAPADDPGHLRRLQDLARPGLKVVVAQGDVPAGAYARLALRQMSADPEFGPDFADRVAANVASQEPNVKQVLAKVQLGEADAGWVYASDVSPAALEGSRAVRVVELPEAYNVTATYPIAIVARTKRRDLAEAFVAYVLSDEGQAALRGHGFLAPEVTR